MLVRSTASVGEDRMLTQMVQRVDDFVKEVISRQRFQRFASEKGFYGMNCTLTLMLAFRELLMTEYLDLIARAY